MSDLVLSHARVFDGFRYLGDVGDVLVRDGRVVSLGGADPTPGAEVVDCGGALLLPGFTDAHVHPVQGGLERLTCDLSDLPIDRAAYLAHVGSYAASRPDLDWVQGGGWAMAAFPGGLPTAAELDAAVADRPVALVNRDHHGMWVNSRALSVAGITRDTSDPVDGRIERDTAGEPTGMLHEGAMDLMLSVLPVADADELRAGFLEGQRHLLSLGITGWQDAIVGEYAGMQDTGPTYLRAAQDGDLVATVVGALWWERERGVEQVAELVEKRKAWSHGRFAATSVKIMQDGVAENGTAALVDPYLDRCGHATSNTGMSFVDPSSLREIVGALDDAGFQVHFHGLGDRGVREALDALEGTEPLRRHQVAHLQLVHPDDVPRFQQLQVVANIQALWACYDEQMVDLTIPFLGEERAARQYPFGDLHRAGARLVAGSDWPVSTPNPLEAIHVAVHRMAYGESGPAGSEPFLPDQALSLEVAPRRLHLRLGVGVPPRRRRDGQARRGRRPGPARPGPVRRSRRGRGGDGRAGVGRRRGDRSVTSRLAAVLWDMDGTLVDSEPIWIAQQLALAEQHGGTWSTEQGLALVGADMHDTAAAMQAAGVEDGGRPSWSRPWSARSSTRWPRPSRGAPGCGSCWPSCGASAFPAPSPRRRRTRWRRSWPRPRPSGRSAWSSGPRTSRRPSRRPSPTSGRPSCSAYERPTAWRSRTRPTASRRRSPPVRRRSPCPTTPCCRRAATSSCGRRSRAGRSPTCARSSADGSPAARPRRRRRPGPAAPGPAPEVEVAGPPDS